MTAYEPILKTCPLFAGIDAAYLDSMLHCLSARCEKYPKGDFLYHQGDAIDSLGIVLSGSIDIMKEDFWGNSNLIARAGVGNIFGEAYALRTDSPIEVSILAKQPSEVMFLNVSKMMTLCGNACTFHNRLTRNLLSVLAEKTFQLSRKLEHITQRTTREKLLSYLTAEAAHTGSNSFDIPFNRQQLADYLSVDRSAMSSELGNLRDEGLITFQKNHFTLQFPSS